MDLAAAGPNTQQIEYWNGQAGPFWVAAQELLDDQIGPLGLLAIDRAAPAPGECVLDLGCGCGQTTVQLGERVGPGGQVTGIDVSTVMLEQAKKRVVQHDNVHFENADAQIARFPARTFDLAFSRFGVMFFADPEVAFANVRSGLKASGRLTFVCWQPLIRNPWLSAPLAAAATQISLPDPPSPGAPGPFAFADTDRVRSILARAGFEKIAFESIEQTLVVGGKGGIEQALQFLLNLGPLGAALREAGDASRPAVIAAVSEALTPFATPEGIRMGAAAWIVTARL
ncbi:MAG: methyltransferase domain-containing protein [Myxococcota bacterium]